MKTLKYFLFGIFIVIALTAVLAFTMKPSQNVTKPSGNYVINNTWELPDALNEISGIAYIYNGIIASVQDEDGIIFIYDLKQNKIIEEIEFAGSGDYEGIAIHNDDAYVMRSDGVIYEILKFRSPGKTISKFETEFSSKNNIETLTVDTKNHNLIIAPKDRGRDDDFKGLYQIPIHSKTMEVEPSVKINMKDAAFKNFRKKKAYKTFRPADVAIHPKTGEFYVVEGRNPKLLILTNDGTVKKVYELDKDEFAQPEGITFSPGGTLYISNESGDGAATIMQVSFN